MSSHSSSVRDVLALAFGRAICRQSAPRTAQAAQAIRSRSPAICRVDSHSRAADRQAARKSPRRRRRPVSQTSRHGSSNGNAKSRSERSSSPASRSARNPELLSSATSADVAASMASAVRFPSGESPANAERRRKGAGRKPSGGSGGGRRASRNSLTCASAATSAESGSCVSESAPSSSWAGWLGSGTSVSSTRDNHRA